MIVQSEHAVDLGVLTRVHKAGADVWVTLVLGCIFGAIAIVTLPIRGTGQPYWSLGVGAIGGLLLYLWSRKRGNEVRVHQNGIYYRRHNVLYALKWKDISQVWQQSVRRSVNFIPVGTFHKYTLQTVDGRFVLKGDLANIQKLGDEIQRGVLATQIQPAIDAYNSGQPVLFGPLALSRVGVTYGNKLLAWTEVRHIDLKDGNIRVVGQGKWFSWASVAVSEVPNFLLFWTLVKEILPSDSGA